MADRQWLVEGVQIYETGEEEYFVEGLQLCENQADAGETPLFDWLQNTNQPVYLQPTKAVPYR